MIPLTAIVVGAWWRWDRIQERRFAGEAEDIEEGINDMEAQIMAAMKMRTQSKQRTWDLGM